MFFDFYHLSRKRNQNSIKMGTKVENFLYKTTKISVVMYISSLVIFLFFVFTHTLFTLDSSHRIR